MNSNPSFGRFLVCHDTTKFAILLPVLLIGTYLLYAGGLMGPLLLDDLPHLPPLFALDTDNYTTLAGNFILNDSGPLRRPVAMATFIFNVVTSGNDVATLKYTNVLIHLLTGLVLIWLAARFLVYSPDPIAQKPWLPALLVAAVWLLHPLQVSTVLYTVQRMTQLSALFGFVGLLLYSIGRQRQIKGLQHGNTLVLLAFLIPFPLSALSKETGLLFPLYTALLEFCLFRFTGSRHTRLMLKGIYALFLVIPSLVALYLTVFDFSHQFRDYLARPFTPEERVYTEFRILADYLYLLIVPMQKNMGFVHDDVNISTSLFSPISTFLSLVFVFCTIVVAIRARKRLPLFSFGILFFYASHLAESTIYPLELMFEHRNYIGSFGIFLGVLSVGSSYLRSANVRRFCAASVIAVLAVLTHMRVDTWSSPDRLLNYMAYAHPGSVRVAVAQSRYLAADGHYSAAQKVLEGHDDFGTALRRLIIRCQHHGYLDESEINRVTHLPAPHISTYEMEGLAELLELTLQDRCRAPPTGVLRILDKSLNLHIGQLSSRQKLLVYKAHYLRRNKKFPEAVHTLVTAYSAYPRNPEPLFFAAQWYIERDNAHEAKRYLAKASAAIERSHLDYSRDISQLRRRLTQLEKGKQ